MRRRGHRLRRAAWNVVGLAVTAVMLFPVYWMISTAFKPEDEVNSQSPTWLPLHPTLQHFRDAMARPFFWQDVRNSVIVVSVTVALSLVLAFLAAVALAKFRFTGRKLFIVLVIGIQMLPAAGLIIPLYIVLARYGQVNSLTGLIVTYMTFVLPFSVWTLRGFLIGIPRDLLDVADVPREEDDAAEALLQPSAQPVRGLVAGEAGEDAAGGEPFEGHALTAPAVSPKAILRCTSTKKTTTGIAISVEPAISPPQSTCRLVP